jgi:cytochrome c oxidase assembly factor CtaG
MPFSIQAALQSSTIPVWPILATILVVCVYLRGWRHLRTASANVIPVWRALSFFLGLFLIWVAVGSPLAAFDEEMLTVHMVQHLLLMTIAPLLMLVGAPVMPVLHGLPRQFVLSILGPSLRQPAVQWIGRTLSEPALGWLAAAGALVGWHLPSAFTLALHSEGWHVVEHVTFLGAGFLFWWPVVQPWPSVPVWPRWTMLPYLFSATLPCDMLSALLAFSDRVVYPAYLSTPRPFGISALEDQQCAGALMWTCVTFVYLVPATILTIQLLAARGSRNDELVQSEFQDITAPTCNPRGLEVS